MFTVLGLLPIILVVILVCAVGYINSFNKKTMNQNDVRVPSAKDFFLNIGAIAALYAVVGSLLNLLFTVINTAYPKVTEGYGYYYNTSQSISWPVAALIIVFPIFIALMWILEKEYKNDPESRNTGIHRFLAYLTLFAAGALLAGNLITVLYYFLDGQELTAGFLLKALSLLVVSLGIFLYYISDIRGTLTSKSRKMWRIIAGVIVLASLVLGFAVMGSPSTQRLYKYDEQKVNDISNINNQVVSHYSLKGTLPANLEEAYALTNYYVGPDPQTGAAYEYTKTGDLTYTICAEFNKASRGVAQQPSMARPTGYYGEVFFVHPEGRHCFEQKVDPAMYQKGVPMR